MAGWDAATSQFSQPTSQIGIVAQLPHIGMIDSLWLFRCRVKTTQAQKRARDFFAVLFEGRYENSRALPVARSLSDNLVMAFRPA